jgi:Flp pilus assembly pilin Flp
MIDSKPSCGRWVPAKGSEESNMALSLRVFRAISYRRRQVTGQALVEYALILLLIAVVAVGALQLIGTNVTGALNAIAGL